MNSGEGRRTLVTWLQITLRVEVELMQPAVSPFQLQTQGLHDVPRGGWQQCGGILLTCAAFGAHQVQVFEDTVKDAVVEH